MSKAVLTLTFMILFAGLSGQSPSSFRDTNGKYGLKDASGKIILSGKYDRIIYFPYKEGKHEELATVTINGKSGYINMQGQEIVAPVFDNAKPFAHGIAAVGNGKMFQEVYGYVNKAGKVIVPLQVKEAGDFHKEGVAVVGVAGKGGRVVKGLIDSTGKEIVPPKYDQIGEFSEGVSDVLLQGKRGFIDLRGKLIIPLKYDSVTKFMDGKSKVTVNGETFFIDKAGRTVK